MRKLEIMADRNGIERRDVLKAMAAPVVAAAMSTLTGCAHGPAATNGFATANGRETAMSSRPLMTVRIAAAPPQKLGMVPHGTRTVVPVTGGDFEGPRLRGLVLPGGGDWLLLRSDGVLELDLRITLETDDGALITVGVGEARPDGAVHRIDEIL